jgi:hypothetical protein
MAFCFHIPSWSVLKHRGRRPYYFWVGYLTVEYTFLSSVSARLTLHYEHSRTGPSVDRTIFRAVCSATHRWILGLIYRMFHLKRNLNYNSISKLWWHQDNETNEMVSSFDLFVWTYRTYRTYRTAVQQTLKVPITFSNTSIHQKFDTSPYIVVLFGTSFSGYVLLNVPQTTKNYFDAK